MTASKNERLRAYVVNASEPNCGRLYRLYSGLLQLPVLGFCLFVDGDVGIRRLSGE